MTNQRDIVVGSCPEQESWAMLAAGVMDEAEADQRLAHASKCPTCADRLKDAISVLRPDESHYDTSLTIDEELVAKRVASQVAGHPNVRARRSESLAWAMAVAAAVVVALSSLAWFVLRENSQDLLERSLLASGEYRTIETRLPGAQHRQLNLERSAVEATQPELKELLIRAEDRRAASPTDAGWAHALGRMELLLRRFDEAIEHLEIAAKLDPSPMIQIELAAALAERAQVNVASGDADALRAIDVLRSLRRSRPRDTVVLFNLALALERREQWSEALGVWREALLNESEPGWRSEIQERHIEYIEETVETISPDEGR